MTTTHQHSPDVIDVVAADWRPTPRAIRAEIHKAIRQAAAEHDGEVHIATVRELLPPWATGPQVGATICALVRSGHLQNTGRYAHSGNRTQRNRTRPAEIRCLVRPIPEVHQP